MIADLSSPVILPAWVMVLAVVGPLLTVPAFVLGAQCGAAAVVLIGMRRLRKTDTEYIVFKWINTRATHGALLYLAGQQVTLSLRHLDRGAMISVGLPLERPSRMKFDGCRRVACGPVAVTVKP
jgi:hypothetical protein